MRIYLASRFSRREELAEYAKALRDLGHQITSRWLVEGNHELPDPLMPGDEADQARSRFAQEDLDDLYDADIFVLFTRDTRENCRGGMHVEFGVAIHTCLRVIVIGPRMNVFHYLPEVEHFPTWEEFLRFPIDG